MELAGVVERGEAGARALKPDRGILRLGSICVRGRRFRDTWLWRSRSGRRPRLLTANVGWRSAARIRTRSTRCAGTQRRAGMGSEDGLGAREHWLGLRRYRTRAELRWVQKALTGFATGVKSARARGKGRDRIGREYRGVIGHCRDLPIAFLPKADAPNRRFAVIYPAGLHTDVLPSLPPEHHTDPPLPRPTSI